jgi:L-histidine Nalpha-methyltransferase
MIPIGTVFDNSEVKKITDRLSIITPPDSGSIEDFASDVRRGLTSFSKYLLPKYFYDNRGSELFEKITGLKEYYPTEVERSIIKNISRILPQIDKNISTIVEIGSGSSNKTKHIIRSYSESRDKVNYIPIDISEIIIQSSLNLLDNYCNVIIDGIIADYEYGLEIVPDLSDEPKLYLFLGSSIGNFTFNESINFLSNISSMMTAQDKLLIGFDRIKDRKVLNKAYDDNQGVTAKFNLNILERINRELNADFNLNEFEHQVRFNEEESRIEMHLVSAKLQTVNIKDLDLQINFEIGESIHTENSYKYSEVMINKLAEGSGLEIVENFTDEQKYFSLCLFQGVKYI